jgi:uncharacterized protein (TIGR03437 family)
MSLRFTGRGLSALLCLVLSLGALSSAPRGPLPPVQAQHPAVHDHDHRHHPGKDWDNEKAAHEAVARHQFNQQRLAQAAAQGLIAAAPEISVTDVDDLSVVQDDGSVVIPARPVDLNGRSVLFTPAGGGYTVTGGAAAYDNNFGTKLDLTRAPAVNPKLATTPGVEAGDDAYITQPLGFDFNFYGTNYASVAISSNGFLVFRPAGTDNQYFDDNAVDSGEALSALQTALPRIAPYWHDLDARAQTTTGASGIYLRTEADKVVITWNGIRDFPNQGGDNGVHSFQAVLFRDGRIQFHYSQVQLTSTALVGLSGGGTAPSPVLVNFADPAATNVNAPLAAYYTTSAELDEVNAIKAFYTAHPNQDVYDFIYVLLDYDQDLLDDAFAYYQPIRNNVTGGGLNTFDSDPFGFYGSRRLQGFLELNNLSRDYPELPTTRFLGVNHALSIFGQEQGHQWLVYTVFPQISRNLLLGRDNAHWSFFFNAESSLSHPAAPRSSSGEGSVLRDNGDGTFTSINLVDGYSKLDQYLMGLRPAEQVPDTFVVSNASAPGGITRSSNPRPNVTLNGTRVNVSVSQIIQANGQITPGPNGQPGVQKHYRAAVLLIEPAGKQPSAALLAKIKRYRLAWESYFAHSTDYLATINTSLTDTTQRTIAVTNAASFLAPLAPGGIGALFGGGLSGATLSATAQPLPTSLGGVEVRVDGVPAPLFFVSPTQINFQMPRTTEATTRLLSAGTVPSATALIEVYRDGQLIRAGAVQTAPALVGTFTLAQNAAAALDAFTFTSGPFNARQANGEPNILALFVTGLGADVTDVDGNVNSQVQVTLNNQTANVLYAGRVAGLVGLNQINFQLPANLAAGTYNLTVARNGFASNVSTITIR